MTQMLSIEPLVRYQRAEPEILIEEEGCQPVLDREVLVWRLPPHSTHDQRARVRFLRDARRLASLHHHNIVQVYSAGEENNQPYIVVERVEGLSAIRRMEQATDRGERMAPEAVLEIVRGVAEGLEYAHRHGVFGFNLMAEAIVLAGDGRTVIGGLARPLPENVQHAGAAALNYAAPERLAGGMPDAAADIYALGVLAAHLLLGRFPFEGSPAGILALKERCASLPPLEHAETARSLPADLLPVLRRATARQSADRYAGVAAFRAALGGMARPAAIVETRAEPVVLERAVGEPVAVAEPVLLERAVGEPVAVAEPVLLERAVGEPVVVESTVIAEPPAPEVFDPEAIDPLMPGRDNPALWAALRYTTLVPLAESDPPAEAPAAAPAEKPGRAPANATWLIFLFVASLLAVSAAMMLG